MIPNIPIKPIDSGDIVFVMRQGEDDLIGTVINLPRGEGDLLQVVLESGDTLAFNPYCNNFIGLRKISK